MRVLFILSFILIFSSCKKDDNGGPDPCNGVQATSAEFTIIEELNREGLWFPEYINYFIDSDTITRNFVTFTVNQEVDSVKWIIGLDPTVRKGRTIKVDFPESERGNTIAVTAYVKTKPNTQCFPEDDGLDTFTRYMYYQFDSLSPVFGKYHGALTDAPEDTFTMEVRWNGEGSSPERELINFPNNFPVSLRNPWVGYYRFQRGVEGGNKDCKCGFAGGEGFLSRDRQTIYIFYDDPYVKQRKTFIGKKIN